MNIKKIKKLCSETEVGATAKTFSIRSGANLALQGVDKNSSKLKAVAYKFFNYFQCILACFEE